MGGVNDYFALNELRREGVRRFSGHISGVNYPIINLNMRTLRVRVVACYVVLRKIYG